MNKKLLSFAMVFLLSLSFTVNTYAMDKRVKSSKSWTVTKEITKKEAKENKKYIYGQVREGARAKDFELAIQWLLDCGLIHKVNRVSKPALPLKAYLNLDAFKIYLLDIGLLIAMTDLDARVIIDGNRIFTEFKGALTEQYVSMQPDLPQ